MMPIRIDGTREFAPHGRRLVTLLLAAALISVACGAPEPERIASWDASDESNTERIDHDPWQDFLDAYVAADPSGVNLVDYAALAANAADAAKLAGYLEYLEGFDPRDYSRAEQMAYWTTSIMR